MRPNDHARRLTTALWGALGIAAAPALSDDEPQRKPQTAEGEAPEARSEDPQIRTLRGRWRIYLRAMRTGEASGPVGDLRRLLREAQEAETGPWLDSNAWTEHREFLAAFDAARESLLRGRSQETLDLARRVFERQEPGAPQERMLTRQASHAQQFLTVEEWERRAELLYRLGREGKIEPETLAVARENLRASLREAVENEVLRAQPAPAAMGQSGRAGNPPRQEAMALIEEITERPIPREEDVPEETRTRIRSLIAQLGAADFQSREEATRALVAGADAVLPFLVGHLSDPDAEIAARSHRIWAEIY